MTPDEMIDRASVLWRSRQLVPFIGSGMSRMTCTDWAAFVQRLEKEAGLQGAGGAADANAAGALVRRADRAVQALAFQDKLSAACRSALFEGKDQTVPEQTAALAKLSWPLVISTNYDDLFVKASNRAAPPIKRPPNVKPEDGKVLVFGRGVEDCRAVLGGLDVPARPALWAIQGFLGECGPGHRKTELARQVVVGHHQYQRVMNDDRLFRRAFAEVFRRRSFLFLGSGLQEDYFVNLFGEILHGFGPGPHPHFALMKEGEADPLFLLTRLNVNLVTYKDHADLPNFLNNLVTKIGEKKGGAHRGTQTAATYALPNGRSLTLKSQELPVDSSGGRSWRVASLGREGKRTYSGGTARRLLGQDVGNHAFLPMPNHENVFSCRDASIVGVTPVHQGSRDVRGIRNVMGELLSAAEAQNISLVQLPLLAAGSASTWHRTFCLVQNASWHSRRDQEWQGYP